MVPDKKSPIPTNRVNEVDLLRFLAALAVVFFHYTFRGYAADDMSVMPYPLLAPVAKYGYLGVQLFFLISGFVILMTASSGGARSFVVSRIVRLYPAFWVCCTITFIVTIFIGEPQYSIKIWQYLINMSMLSGFLNVPAVDGAYWSLFIEIQFYALVVIVLLLNRIHQAELILVAWLLCTIFLEAIPIGKLRYLLIVDYSAFFIAGAMLYLIWSKGITLVRAGAVFAAWVLAVAGSLKALPHMEKHYNTEMSGYVVITIVSLFFLTMILISMKCTGVIGRTRYLVIGALTYPLYLLHQNVGFMIFNFLYPSINVDILLWGVIALVIFVSYLINTFIERRFGPKLKKIANNLINTAANLHRRWKRST